MIPVLRWILRQPMKFESSYFVDKVTGTTVCLWTDEDGRGWMSTNRWGFGKVRSSS